MKLLTTRPVDATSSGFLDRDSAVEFSTWIFFCRFQHPKQSAGQFHYTLKIQISLQPFHSKQSGWINRTVGEEERNVSL